MYTKIVGSSKKMVKYSDAYWQDVQQALTCVPDLHDLFGKSILITGATGMICSAVVELLFELNRSRHADIRICLAGRNKQRIQNRFSPFLESIDYTYMEYDATKDATLDVSADYIIHGASPADPASFSKLPVETMLTNLCGLKSLLELTKRQDKTRLLYISSSEVYGKKESAEPYRETDYGFVDILNPRACYPSSKRAAETLCAAYRDEYDVDFVVGRPGHIYGPTITEFDSRASAQFTRSAVAGDDIVMKSAGSQIRSYTYSLDCASAILTVLLSGKSGEAYNISNSSSLVTIREFAECLATTAGVQLVFEQASTTEKKSYNMMDNSSLFSEKLEQLGWKGCFDLQSGIRATLKFARS